MEVILLSGISKRGKRETLMHLTKFSNEKVKNKGLEKVKIIEE